IQFVPGGPVERMVSLMEKGHDNGGGEVAASASVQTGSYRGSKGLDPEQVAQLRHLYGFDQPPV
ncbi:MAG TPA: microcin ABC transporter permease, partial [Alphaproteobacteria bacterium]|nr:microcin ABC transporter permease [Alphaproteobacteria bacterium]